MWFEEADEVLAMLSTWYCGRVTLFTISKVGWNCGFEFLPEEEKEIKKSIKLTIET